MWSDGQQELHLTVPQPAMESCGRTREGASAMLHVVNENSVVTAVGVRADKGQRVDCLTPWK
jgi:hypothetical protein